MQLKDVKKKMVVKSTGGICKGQEGVVLAVGPIPGPSGKLGEPVVTVQFEDGDNWVRFHKFPEDLEPAKMEDADGGSS